MAKTANIYTRVDPTVKEQAETVLNQLGISMATAMEMYLRQIALQRKIPFEMALPNVRPIALDDLSDKEFDALMERAVKEYADGNYVSVQDFEKQMEKEFNV